MTLYRQYRPTTFGALFGQDTARTILQNALARERLAHAYLFSGPRGTGKTTTARILARAATCERPVIKQGKEHAVFEPCNTCASCLAQLADHATDIVEIDAASNRGIEDIRQLREQAQYLPMTLKRKVYIIDEVHMLTPDAFNALLKTLEEPPKHCLFILATTEFHKVPATIRSRCQLIRFERGSVEAIAGKLRQIIEAEKWTVAPEVAELVAIHAHGGFRDAEGLLEQLVTHHSTLTKAQAIEALGITDTSLLEQLLTTSLQGSLAETSQLLATIDVPDQPRCETLVTDLIELVRARIHATPQPNNDALLALTDALTKLLEGYVLIKGSPHPKLVLETICYEIAASGQRGIKADPLPPLEETHSPATAERVTLPTPVQAREPMSITPLNRKEPVAPVVELRPAAIKDVRQAWKEVIRSVSKDNAPLAQMLRETVIHTAENQLVQVHAKYKFHVEKLSEKKNRIRVEGLLHEITHDTWNVDYQLKDNLPRHDATRGLTGATAEAAASVFGN